MLGMHGSWVTGEVVGSFVDNGGISLADTIEGGVGEILDFFLVGV